MRGHAFICIENVLNYYRDGGWKMDAEKSSGEECLCEKNLEVDVGLGVFSFGVCDSKNN